MSNWDWFQQQAEALGVSVTDAQVEQFRRFHELLVEANRTTNLTRITDERDAIVKHYLDALLFLRMVPDAWHEKPLRFIDVGTGAGIPGVPLLIMRPHWSGVMLDSVAKKLAFIDGALAALGLGTGTTLHGRAEDFGHDPAYRDGCDLACARAVAALNELAELTLPFVKPHGLLVVSKGSRGPDELAEARLALQTLKGGLQREETLFLPEEAGERRLYVIEKLAPTPKGYPRKPGIPHRKPIC